MVRVLVLAPVLDHQMMGLRHQIQVMGLRHHQTQMVRLRHHQMQMVRLRTLGLQRRHLLYTLATYTCSRVQDNVWCYLDG